jgi:hypothetical protein
VVPLFPLPAFADAPLPTIPLSGSKMSPPSIELAPPAPPTAVKGPSQRPAVHVCPAGQVAPSQSSTQLPATQCVAVSHVTLTQSCVKQRLSLHTKPVAQPLQLQL